VVPSGRDGWLSKPCDGIRHLNGIYIYVCETYFNGY
jgi:hypothetical protein